MIWLNSGFILPSTSSDACSSWEGVGSSQEDDGEERGGDDQKPGIPPPPRVGKEKWNF